MEKTPKGNATNQTFNGSSPDMFKTPSEKSFSSGSSSDAGNSSSDKSFASNRSSVPGTPGILDTAFCATPGGQGQPSGSQRWSVAGGGGTFVTPAPPKSNK